MDRIVTDPEICHGKPILRGTRVLVSVVEGCIEEEVSYDEILKQYPTLSVEDIDAVVEYRRVRGAWFTEVELLAIGLRADYCIEIVESPKWKRAYDNLAFAADVLHAMMRRARIDVHHGDTEGTEKKGAKGCL